MSAKIKFYLIFCLYLSPIRPWQQYRSRPFLSWVYLGLRSFVPRILMWSWTLLIINTRLSSPLSYRLCDGEGGGGRWGGDYKEKGLLQTMKADRRFPWGYRSDMSSVNLGFTDGTSFTNVIPLPGNSTLVWVNIGFQSLPAIQSIIVLSGSSRSR